jgi:hypothetical protein
MLNIVSVHFVLWLVGLHHRDISPKNLMVCVRPDEEPCGVLIDYDLARLEGSESQNHDRTGTLPFLALTLLTKEAMEGTVPHIYSHDAESFIWVLIWILHRYRDGTTEITRNKGPLLRWLSPNFEEIRSAKKDLRDDVREQRIKGAHSVYHYRAEILGEYFSHPRNTIDFDGQPMNFVVNEIKRLLTEPPRRIHPKYDDRAWFEEKMGTDGKKQYIHRNTDPLELPKELLAISDRRGDKIVD